jgi:hypothetical protein
MATFQTLFEAVTEQATYCDEQGATFDRHLFALANGEPALHAMAFAAGRADTSNR